MPNPPPNDELNDPFLDALLARSAKLRQEQNGNAPSNLQPSSSLPVPGHPEERLTLAGGEVVRLPAVPALAMNDVNGWKRHVRALLRESATLPPDQRWRHRLDHDASESLLAMDEGNRPGMGAIEPLLRAGVSENPSAGAPSYMSAGMQEALLGLTLSLGVPIGAEDLRAAARHTTHVHLMQRLLHATGPQNPTRFGPPLLAKVPDVLHAAVANPHPAALDIIDTLVAHGAPLDDINQQGYSPVGEAVERNNLPALERLLHHGAPVDLCSDRALPPLVEAVTANIGGLVPMLIAAGASTWHKADPNNPEQHYAMTTIAVKHGSDQALAALIEAGLDPLQPDPHLAAHRITIVELARVNLEQWRGNPREERYQRCLDLLDGVALRQTMSDPTLAEQVEPAKARPRL